MKRFAIILIAIWLSCHPSAAEESNVSVERTSPNHTKIVIHNTSPEAYSERNQRAMEAQERLELKRQRKHELELARIEAQEREAKTQAQPRRQAQQPKIYRKKKHQPSRFMNGGRPTMGVSFASPYGGYGYGGYGYGYAPRYSYRGNNCGRRSYSPRRAYRANCRPARRISRPSRPVSRGRRCR
jgi:hypothetical protein